MVLISLPSRVIGHCYHGNVNKMEEGEHVDETEAFEKDDVEDPGNCDQDPGEISLKKKTHSKPR